MGTIPNHIAVGGGYRKGRIPPTCMKGENDMGVMKWIPCSEKLPDVGEKIICTIVKMSMNEGLYLDVDVVTFSPGYESIIEAWMPCPSPWLPEP